jgi:hypothetical protein
MIKALMFMAIGAIGAYLYMNPVDVEGAGKMVKEGINHGATIIQEATND